jgi:hypothetical protein
MQLSPIGYLSLAPVDHLKFVLPLGLWTTANGLPVAGDPNRVAGVDRVRAALRQIDEVAASLKAPTNHRASAAAKTLAAMRAPLAASLAAFDSVGADCDGPAARELIARLEATRGALEAAQTAFSLASRSEIKVARAALDEVEADDRALGRDIAALAKAMAFPMLPDLNALTRAREQTSELVRSAGNPAMRTRSLHMALDQGKQADATAASFWPCFEPATGRAAELCEIRASRYAEDRG